MVAMLHCLKNYFKVIKEYVCPCPVDTFIHQLSAQILFLKSLWDSCTRIFNIHILFNIYTHTQSVYMGVYLYPFLLYKSGSYSIKGLQEAKNGCRIIARELVENQLLIQN